MVAVSVIIPVFNGEKYLPQCLESVLASTLEDVEIIVIDDEITDRSALIAGAYAGVNVVRQKHGCAGAARNEGLRRAAGEYVYFLDADDYIAPTLLENVYREARAKQLDGVLFNMQPVYESPELEAHFKTWYDGPYEKTAYGVVLDGKEMFSRLERNNEYRTYVQRQLWRRSFLLENECWSPENVIHQDEYFSMRAILFSKRIECFAEDGVFRRYQAGSVTVSSSRAFSYQCYFIVCCMIARMVQELFPDVPAAKRQLGKLWTTMVDGKREHEVFPQPASDFPDKEYLTAFAAYVSYLQVHEPKPPMVDEDAIARLQAPKDVYLYGAGIWGRKIYGILAERGVAIERFLVTDSAENPTAVCGTKVAAAADVLAAIDKDASAIVVCIKNQGDQLAASLKERGFNALWCCEIVSAGTR